MNNFDVIVVGGGNAGIEAAYSAANMGMNTVLFTIDKSKIAVMPCNPSLGGLGKGHIIYEVSALGGLMPKLASKTYLQARMLNTSKGPAVQGLRLQIDKFKYSKCAQEELLKTKNLTIVEGMVSEVFVEVVDGRKKITGVGCADGVKYSAQSVIITSGTFLNGVIHIGKTNYPSGRRDESAATGLTESLETVLGVKFGRLKTGTPPRLLRSSINFEKLETQEPQKLDYLYEYKHFPVTDTYSCFIAKTNQKTHKIISDNLHQSALYGGNITGIGPRYCPSIEDKVARFADRAHHHVFVEPEGGDQTECYPAGISTSLPLDVQEKYVNSIEGFENAVITKPGYAIEYDFLQPNHLTHSLETKEVEGLFFAGQVHGTTGYEEAAGLGIIAGINAVLKIRGEKPFIPTRTESYIGVMIDDLITLGVDEPYRMFTSRAERRLLLRQDNVFLRLMPYGKKFGLINDETYQEFLEEKQIIEKSVDKIMHMNSRDNLFKLFHSLDFTVNELKKIEAKELLCNLFAVSDIQKRTLLTIHAEVRYEGYLEKERKEAEKTKKFLNLLFPAEMSFKGVPGLTREIQDKLILHKPKSVAQAQLIPGMTPAAISILIFQTRQQEKASL